MPKQHDQWYFIRSVKRRVRIVSVPNDEWTYELTTLPATAAETGDVELQDQVAFDDVLAELRLINLHLGRQIVNVFIRTVRLDYLSPPVEPSTQRMRRLDAPRK